MLTAALKTVTLKFKTIYLNPQCITVIVRVTLFLMDEFPTEPSGLHTY